MKQAFVYNDICPKCGKQSLKIKTRYGALVSINSDSIDTDKTELLCIKCINCGEEFLIDWTKHVITPYLGEIEI